MHELIEMHFLKISGMIGKGRKNEFVNTIKFACGMITGNCVEKNLWIDIFKEDGYYFFSSWSTEEELRKFLKSEEFLLIRAAYDAIGILEKIEVGYDVEIKRIQIDH